MIFLYTLLSFLIGGCLPFAGNILTKRLPADIGSFFILILKDFHKRPFVFSLRYAVMTFLFFAFFVVSGVLDFSFPIYLLLSVFLAVLIYTDETDLLLPDAITLPLLVLGLYLSMGSFSQLLVSVYGVLWGFALSVLVGLAATLKKPDSFGGGDMKLLMALGAFVGPLSLSFLILCSLPFFLTDFFLRGKKKFVPYGPSLILAFLVTLLLTRETFLLTFF